MSLFLHDWRSSGACSSADFPGAVSPDVIAVLKVAIYLDFKLFSKLEDATTTCILENNSVREGHSVDRLPRSTLYSVGLFHS